MPTVQEISDRAEAMQEQDRTQGHAHPFDWYIDYVVRHLSDQEFCQLFSEFQLLEQLAALRFDHRGSIRRLYMHDLVLDRVLQTTKG